MLTSGKQSLKKLARPIIAILFLSILILKGPFKIEQITYILKQPRILILGFVLFFVQFSIAAYRWNVIVEIIKPFKIKLAWFLTMIGLFFSYFIPGGVGGDLVKAVELSKTNGVTKKDALSTVFADRILGLYAMVLFSTVFLGLDYYASSQESIFKYFLFSLVLFLAMTTGLLFGPWIVHRITKNFSADSHKFVQILEKIITSFSLTFSVFRATSIFTKVLFLSAVIQLISSFFMIEVVKSLGVTPPSFFVYFSLSCFGFLASAIPITPAGIGVGQAAFYFLFSPISSELGNAAVTAVSMLQLFNFAFALIGGILFSTKPLFKFDTKDLE